MVYNTVPPCVDVGLLSDDDLSRQRLYCQVRTYRDLMVNFRVELVRIFA